MARRTSVAVHLAEVDDEDVAAHAHAAGVVGDAAAPSAAVLSSTLLAFRISVPPWLRMPPALAGVRL